MSACVVLQKSLLPSAALICISVRDTVETILMSWIRTPPWKEKTARNRPHLELASTASGALKSPVPRIFHSAHGGDRLKRVLTWLTQLCIECAGGRLGCQGGLACHHAIQEKAQEVSPVL